MNEDRRKAKQTVTILFLLCICIALACFGVFAYIAITCRSEGTVNQRIVTISKIIVMAGVFFLVLAFGYLLPVMISHKKRGVDKSESDTHDIFDETNMRKALEKYIPDGEILLAGIHAIAKEMSVTGIFGNCVLAENGLIPDESGGAVALNKKKYSAYDIYLGITQYSMVIGECEKNNYFYQFDDVPDMSEADIQEVTSELYFSDIGTCFRLADIISCEIKNGWMGSVKCFITMKNGSYFKLIFPKLGGLGGAMPHHTEYRRAIIARLGGRNY